ncbi:MAG: hypothetical protein J5545_10915 [Bacteroidaceae bacterium]|nr:hypothetical protein [Bacteroidaceae bacterium]
MELFSWKKKNGDKKVELSQEEIEELKKQLKAKMEEYKTIYDQLLEVGGTELPEDVLDVVSGGSDPIHNGGRPSAAPSYNFNYYDEESKGR